MANLLLTMQREQQKKRQEVGDSERANPAVEHVGTTVGGRLDSIITLRLYPKSYLKISFTTRELINVNISRRSSLTGTTTTGAAGSKTNRELFRSSARRGYTLSSLKCISIRERRLDKK